MQNSNQSAHLLSQRDVVSDPVPWHRTAAQEIEKRIADPAFPCVFSRNALRKHLLLYVFVEDAAGRSMEHLAGGLREYVELSSDWDGRLDTAYPLVVVFAPDAVDADSVAGYQDFGWRVLQRLHELDPLPWPDGVSQDPDSTEWSMSFNGMPLFCNMSSPAHRIRRSRNLGGNFVLVVNPRERFDVFAGDTPSGRKVRANIRNRIDRYDGATRSLQLGSYGAGALEWTQYGLIEENAERTDSCPFKHRNLASN